MPPARRTRRSSRPYSFVAAAEPCSNRGWLSARCKPSKKRARRSATTISEGDEDDGTPLTDEILVGIFAGLPDLADLVRCACTCRWWRRLVSGEAAFICRTARRGAFLRGLALGFFYTHRHGAVPRFAPTASASRRLGLRHPSLNALVDGLDDGLFDSSRLVPSRKGLLVVELKHRKHVLKLCVCNPMTGEVIVLPPLSGKESVGCYACTVLTAADDYDGDQSCCGSSYRLVLVYTPRTFTACRNYSSDDGTWGPEAKVSTASGLTQKQMAAMTGAGVAISNAVYWLARNKVFGLDLDTMQAQYVDMPVNGYKTRNPAGNTLLCVSPDGRLRTVQVTEHVLATSSTSNERSVAVRTNTRRAHRWESEEVIQVAQWLPAEATSVKLRWVGENSGVVFFSAGGCGDQTSDMYALNLDKKEVELVASHHVGGGEPSWGNLHGYEMDQRLYLASLALDEDYS